MYYDDFKYKALAQLRSSIPFLTRKVINQFKLAESQLKIENLL